MKRILWMLVLAGVSVLTGAGEEPRLSKERVVLHTLAGDIVLAFFPDVAPKHTEQLLKLFRLGVYDGFHFHRLYPDFVAQTSHHHERATGLTEEQTAAIQRIPAEFSDLPIDYGLLTLAHADGDPDSGETSFSIHLGPAPHMRGQYTVFGKVVHGMDVIPMMFKLPRNKDHRPHIRVEITHTTVVNSHEELSKLALVAPMPIRIPEEFTEWEAKKVGAQVPFFVAGIVGVMMLVSFATFLFSNRLSPKVLYSLNLINVLVGGFFLLMLLAPQAPRYPWLGLGLFGMILGLFKLMGRFESHS